MKNNKEDENKEKKEKKGSGLMHFEKYITTEKYNKMQIAAVGSKVKKTDVKTDKEWKEFFNKIINMRLH
jgi:hypothetical protein